MKIGICDDDKAVQEILRRKVDKICADAGICADTVCFSSGREVLCAAASGSVPDILLLDIQMPEQNGMDIARQLRAQQCGTVLIFVTALSEYVYDAFDVGAFQYLVKPFSDQKLREVLERAAGQAAEREKENDKRVILVKRGGTYTKIALDDIIYAEVYNRKVMLHTIRGDVEYYGRMTDLSERAGSGFYRTHRAYLVNFKYVERYTASTVWMEKGSAIIAKKQFPGFVKQYMQYLGDSGGIRS